MEINLPKSKSSKSKVQLGVSEPKIGGAIQDVLPISCVSSDLVHELLRGIRLHINQLISQFKEGDLEKAQLGLGHSYSRAKVKFNVNRQDNMVTQAISLLDQLDKDLNTFSMRVREWYSWHFPELIKIVSDNYLYSRLVRLIKNKSNLSETHLAAMEEITQDETKAKQILDAARSSMGTDISDIDLINIETFATRVMNLHEYRKNLYDYLCSKMNTIAPNLSSLIGEVVGARLISKAGSLTNLSKYPASTVQILGAEKALFRALKTRGNTPKYGLIFHSSFIGKAAAKNKGRISRYLANKCSIASRIDCFTETPTNLFGNALKKQVEQRLEFYESGAKPPRNIDVMHDVIEEVGKEAGKEEKQKTPKRKQEDDGDKKKKKSKSDEKEEKTPKKEEKTPKKAEEKTPKKEEKTPKKAEEKTPKKSEEKTEKAAKTPKSEKKKSKE